MYKQYVTLNLLFKILTKYEHFPHSDTELYFSFRMPFRSFTFKSSVNLQIERNTDSPRNPCFFSFILEYFFKLILHGIILGNLCRAVRNGG